MRSDEDFMRLTRVLYLLALVVWALTSCYNAAPWCTKAPPCHTTPKDSTKTDSTHKGEG